MCIGGGGICSTAPPNAWWEAPPPITHPPPPSQYVPFSIIHSYVPFFLPSHVNSQLQVWIQLQVLPKFWCKVLLYIRFRQNIRKSEKGDFYVFEIGVYTSYNDSRLRKIKENLRKSNKKKNWFGRNHVLECSGRGRPPEWGSTGGPPVA